MAASILKRGLAAYTRAYNARPYSVSFATCFVKAGLADLIAQTKLEKSNDGVNWKRTLAFSVWGGAYCGSAQHVIFTRLIPSMSPRSALGRVALDQFAFTPFAFCRSERERERASLFSLLPPPSASVSFLCFCLPPFDPSASISPLCFPLVPLLLSPPSALSPLLINQTNPQTRSTTPTPLLSLEARSPTVSARW